MINLRIEKVYPHGNKSNTIKHKDNDLSIVVEGSETYSNIYHYAEQKYGIRYEMLEDGSIKAYTELSFDRPSEEKLFTNINIFEILNKEGFTVECNNAFEGVLNDFIFEIFSIELSTNRIDIKVEGIQTIDIVNRKKRQKNLVEKVEKLKLENIKKLLVIFDNDNNVIINPLRK